MSTLAVLRSELGFSSLDFVEDVTEAADEESNVCAVCKGSSKQQSPIGDGLLKFRGNGCELCKAVWFVKFREMQLWQDRTVLARCSFMSIAGLAYNATCLFTLRAFRRWIVERSLTERVSSS